MADTPMPRAPRRHQLYEQFTLRGPIPPRLIWTPPLLPDAPQSLIKAASIDDRFADSMIERAKSGDMLIHRLQWLTLLNGATQDNRRIIRDALKAYFNVYAKYDPRSWSPAIAADRLAQLTFNISTLSNGEDGPWRNLLLDQLAQHVRHLRRAERRLPAEHVDALNVGLSRAMAVMMVPNEDSLGEAMTPRLDRILRRICDDFVPVRWRHPHHFVWDHLRLEALVRGFISKRLSPPAALTGAAAVAEQLTTLFVAPDGRLAHAPGGSDAALSPSIPALPDCPDARRFSAPLGRWRLAQERTCIFVDAGHTRDPDGSGGFALYDGATPIIVNCGRPSSTAVGVSSTMRKWHRALGSPAASSTLDCLQAVIADAKFETGPEGELLELHRARGPDLHARRLFLAASGHELRGEDRQRGKTSPRVFRFHLASDAVVAVSENACEATISVGGTTWCLVTHHAHLSIEASVSAWHDGHIIDTQQIVLAPKGDGVRWALRRM